MTFLSISRNLTKERCSVHSIHIDIAWKDPKDSRENAELEDALRDEGVKATFVAQQKSIGGRQWKETAAEFKNCKNGGNFPLMLIMGELGPIGAIYSPTRADVAKVAEMMKRAATDVIAPVGMARLYQILAPHRKGLNNPLPFIIDEDDD